MNKRGSYDSKDTTVIMWQIMNREYFKTNGETE